MLIIVDTGTGNFGSIENILKKIGHPAELTSNPDRILSATKIILPGVGAFANCMAHIDGRGLRAPLAQKVLQERVPVLGICVGMQVLTEASEEGGKSGLGWIPGRTVRFEFPETDKLRVPHMGWNAVEVQQSSPIWQGLEHEARFYFLHSFYVCPTDARHILATTNYGTDFVSAVRRDNIYGVQFHPEKSHRFGMTLLRNFVERC